MGRSTSPVSLLFILLSAFAFTPLLLSGGVEIRIADGTDAKGGKGSEPKKKEKKTGPELSRDPDDAVNAGPLLPLLGECFAFEDKVYKYELCPFQNVTQTQTQMQKKSRRNAFVLGVWGEWSPDGKMWRYTDGDGCGDINRTVTVSVVCDAFEFKLLKPEEPSTCEYTMEFQVPIACAAMCNYQQYHDSEPSSSKKKGKLGTLFSLF